jgi:hypothetical protein
MTILEKMSSQVNYFSKGFIARRSRCKVLLVKQRLVPIDSSLNKSEFQWQQYGKFGFTNKEEQCGCLWHGKNSGFSCMRKYNLRGKRPLSSCPALDFDERTKVHTDLQCAANALAYREI